MPIISPAKKPTPKPESIDLCQPILMGQAMQFAHIHTLEFSLSLVLDPARSSFEQTAWLFVATFRVNEDVWYGWADQDTAIAEAMAPTGTQAVRRALDDASLWMDAVDSMPALAAGVEVRVNCQTDEGGREQYSATIFKDGQTVEEITQRPGWNWFWPTPARHAAYQRAIELFGLPQ